MRDFYLPSGFRVTLPDYDANTLRELAISILGALRIDFMLGSSLSRERERELALRRALSDLAHAGRRRLDWEVRIGRHSCVGEDCSEHRDVKRAEVLLGWREE